MKFAFTAIFMSLAIVAGGAFAGPIGTVESNGVYNVIAGGEGRAARFKGSEYTFYSGDSIRSQAESTVLNLNSGGGLGMPRGTEVTVVRDDEGTVRAELKAGSLLYAFPAEQTGFEFRVGNFTVRGQSPEPQAMQVSRGDASVGTVEMVDGGNLRAAVRSGQLFIENGDSVRYAVSAGETVGLMDLPERMRTQATTPPAGGSPPVLMQSPERVSTNEEFLMRWEAAEPVDGDYVVIAKSGAEPDEFESLVSSDEGNELSLEAPGSPGDYEIRFIDGKTGEIKRFVYLDVVQGGAPVFWANNPVVGGALSVAAGGVAIYIGSEIVDDDNNRRPVSP